MIEELEPASVEEAGQDAIVPPQAAAQEDTAQEETSGKSAPSLRDTLAQGLKEAKAREERDGAGEEKPAAEEQGAGKEKGRGDKSPASPRGQKPSTAPASWSAQAKAKFAGLDPVVQGEIAKREREITQGFGRIDAERALGRQVREISMPYLAHIQAEGGDPAAAFNDYLKTAYLMRTGTPQQKGQALLHIARQFGADLSAQQTPRVHPAIQAMQNEIAALKQADRQRLDHQQRQDQQRTVTQLEAFATDPRNVHFREVMDDMNALISTGRAADIRQAYDMAVWARPEIRSTLLQGQQAQAEAKRRADAKNRADAARRAGSSVTGSPGLSAPSAPPERSLRDELRANLNAVRS
jgi:hypothetical protein